MDLGHGVFATFGENNQQDFEAMNKGITPMFLYVSVQDFAASEKENRAVYIDKECVALRIAGDPFTITAHPVTDFDRQRFPEAYRHWKESKQQQEHVAGTPLAMWPPATPSLIKEAESVNIYSVENLSDVADGNLGRLSDGRSWREKAIAWLRVAKDSAAGNEYAAQLERANDRIKALEITISTAPEAVSENERLRARLEALEKASAKPKKSVARSKAASERAKAMWAKRRGTASDTPDNRPESG